MISSTLFACLRKIHTNVVILQYILSTDDWFIQCMLEVVFDLEMEPILANDLRIEITYNLRQLMLIQQLTGRKGWGINFFYYTCCASHMYVISPSLIS